MSCAVTAVPGFNCTPRRSRANAVCFPILCVGILTVHETGCARSRPGHTNRFSPVTTVNFIFPKHRRGILACFKELVTAKDTSNRTLLATQEPIHYPIIQGVWVVHHSSWCMITQGVIADQSSSWPQYFFKPGDDDLHCVIPPLLLQGHVTCRKYLCTRVLMGSIRCCCGFCILQHPTTFLQKAEEKADEKPSGADEECVFPAPPPARMPPPKIRSSSPPLSVGVCGVGGCTSLAGREPVAGFGGEGHSIKTRAGRAVCAPKLSSG